MNESDYRWVDDPTLDLVEDGDVAVAWVDQARKDVFFQRLAQDGTARHPPIDVSRSPGTFSWLPRVVVAKTQPERVFLLWQEIVFSGGSHGGEIFFARSSDGGRTFAPPANLSRTPAGDGKGRLDATTWDNGSLDLVEGPGGELYAAWTEYEGALWLRRSRDGETFSEPVQVGGSASAPARGPSVAVGRDRAVHVAWTVGEDPSADIHVASSSDGGTTFGAPRKVRDTRGHSDAPRLAVDRQGTVHLVHAESPAGPRRRYHLRYARMRRGAGVFDEPRTIVGAPGGGAESASYPEVVVDAEQRVFLLWEQFPDAGGRPRSLALTYSKDGGEHFGPPSRVPGIAAPEPGFNGSQQGLFMKKLAARGPGAVAVVNSTFLPDDASHVWLLRGRVED